MSTNLTGGAPPPTQPPLFVERPDGMWEFCGHTFEDHVECWQEVDGQVQKDKWKLSTIAASLDIKYKGKTVDRFAHETRRSSRRIREYAQTWRAFQNSERSPILSFHHHTVAATADDPVEAIHMAEDKEWSTRELEHWIKTGEEPREKNGEDKNAKRDKSEHLPPEADVPLFSKEACGFLDDYMLELAQQATKIPADIDKGEREALEKMIYEQGADALRMKKRTVRSDCEAIVKVMKDTEAASHDGEMAAADLYVWMENLRYFMAESEFKERLEYMTLDTVRMALLTDAGKDGKQEERRGSLPGIVCIPWRKVWDQSSKRTRDVDDDED